MARSLYKIKNNNGVTIDFGTVSIEPSEELVIFDRAKDYTIESGDILRQKINEGVLIMYRIDETIMTDEEAHESITGFENNFGKLSLAALQLPEIRAAFYKESLIQLSEEIRIENQNLADEQLTLHILVACTNGLIHLVEDEFNNLTPNSTWTTELINKYKDCVAAIKIN